LLCAHDVPCAPCGTREQWFDSEVVRDNGLRTRVEDAQWGPVEMPSVPIELHATPASVRHLLRRADADALLRERSRPAPLAPREPGASRAGPLQGIEVLDLGTVISTPFAAAILASFGASVIKVESTGGDAYRNGPGCVGYNRDKRGLAFDLKDKDCRALFEKLLERADVVCDNFRVGVLQRLGLDYAQLCATHPRLIGASVTAFGQRGPLRDRPGFDPLIQAMSGLMTAQGGARDEHAEPVFHQIPVNDVASALILSFGICAALVARERTGHGQRVTTSLAAQGCTMQLGELTRFRGRAANPDGARDCSGLHALRRFYRCGDQSFIAIACSTPAQAAALYRAIGDASWHATCAAELALQQPVTAPITECIARRLETRSAEAWLELLARAEVPAAKAQRPQELDKSPLHLAHRYFDFVRRKDGERALPTPRSYAEFSRTPASFSGRDPACGEHSREILHELGCDDAGIDALRAAGVLTQA
jgi:crotonobetainyl-CoA:carnitine CoA-transferase CaiB-like acyl-CoA transferase